MTTDASLMLDPMTPAEIGEYRKEVMVRLAISYERYRSMTSGDALSLATRRVAALTARTGGSLDTRLFAIRHLDQRIGSAAVSFNREESHLFVWDIFIDPTHRRLGHGRRAMEVLQQMARAEGLQRLQLSIEYGNVTSTDFFGALGYAFVAITAVRPVQ